VTSSPVAGLIGPGSTLTSSTSNGRRTSRSPCLVSWVPSPS
jgi:hypothetical protein